MEKFQPWPLRKQMPINILQWLEKALRRDGGAAERTYFDTRPSHTGRAMNVMRAALWPILAAARRAENPLATSFPIIAASA